MDAHKRNFTHTGKTFKSLSPPPEDSYSSSHGQIVPYSEFHIHNEEFNTAVVPQALRVKNPTSRSIMAGSDIKRQRRIASYKMYTAEGKVKLSFSRSIRWIKNKYMELRYGLS